MVAKQVSEYKRQFTWHEFAPLDKSHIAGQSSLTEKRVTEPPLQALKRSDLQVDFITGEPKERRTFGSPSKDLHLTREPSFHSKKRVPGSSPERIKPSLKVDKSLAKKAGLLKNVNTARYQSEYVSRFSPKKEIVPRPGSPIQNSKLNFADSKTNLPIGKKPVDKKTQSEYACRYQDPTSELKLIRDLYKENALRKQLAAERAKVVTKPATKSEKAKKEVAPPTKSTLPVPDIPDEPPKELQRKLRLKIASPLKGNKTKVTATYDLIAPRKTTAVSWKSEYNSKYDSPIKEEARAVSAYGRRSHPYYNRAAASADRVSELIKPDPSEAACGMSLEIPSTWYNEVVELRRMAEQYKAKSHGSHFSPNKMANLAFSSAQLRETTELHPEDRAEVDNHDIVADSAEVQSSPVDAPKPENDVVVTDLEDCPNIDNLIIKTKSLTTSDIKAPVTPVATYKSQPPVRLIKSPASVKSRSPVTTPPKSRSPVASTPRAVSEASESTCSTPRTAVRSSTLFAGRVPTPKLKNAGSRHHYDRTTEINPKEGDAKLKTVLMEGRVATPTLVAEGGSRHHLDSTTPAGKGLIGSTQPFNHIHNAAVEKPGSARDGWTKDLDETVLSRASSCTSLAGETLAKASSRANGSFW